MSAEWTGQQIRTWPSWVNLALAGTFGILTSIYLVIGGWGSDARLYLVATRLWLSAGDPWSATLNGVGFAAPPPTLLIYAPFAWMPPDAFAGMIIVADCAAIVWLVRRLRLPWYFVLFPPFVEGAVPGSVEPIMVACLVAGYPMTEAAAAAMKVYGVVPLLLRWQWRGWLVFLVVLAVTWWLLPWTQFIADWHHVEQLLATMTRLGAAMVPLLIPFAVLGLISLGRQRASWLAVPTLWPATQLHYNLLALPAMSPLVALGAALPIPGAMQLAVIADAIWVRARGATRRGRAGMRRP